MADDGWQTTDDGWQLSWLISFDKIKEIMRKIYFLCWPWINMWTDDIRWTRQNSMCFDPSKMDRTAQNREREPVTFAGDWAKEFSLQVTGARVSVCERNMLVSLSSDKSSKCTLKVLVFNSEYYRQSWTQKFMRKWITKREITKFPLL